MKYSVEHKPLLARFEAKIEDHTAFVSYRRGVDVIHINHTYVPPIFEGKGIAAALVKATLDYARVEGLKVDPICSYVKVYFQRHPEEADLL